MREIAADLRVWLERGTPFALATVVATRKSAPRPVGSSLAVSEAGQIVGSVSGGCVEGDVYNVAQEILAGADPRLVTYGITDDQAFEVGLPCGGEIDVLVRRAEPGATRRALEALARDEPVAVRTSVTTGELEVVPADGLRTALEGDVFVDVWAPPLQLVVFGAVDTAEGLCAVARALGWRTVVADARARFATPERIPSADELLVAWPDEALEQVRPDARTAVVVLSHEERFDVPALAGALATPAFYVGALGSRRTQEKRRARLLEAGVGDEALERLRGPAGLDVGAATPAEVAVSILAEILAVRAGREGGALRDGAGRIHASAT